jgi:NTP pyrophosphatase (non-canonical NTP hydrolase)
MHKSVAWFTEQMEQKLKENRHKGGWSKCERWWLIKRLKEEVYELDLSMGRHLSNSEEIIREAADVANFAMMIADNEKRRIHRREKRKEKTNERNI